jgi:hypothetical protein
VVYYLDLLAMALEGAVRCGTVHGDCDSFYVPGFDGSLVTNGLYI